MAVQVVQRGACAWGPCGQASMLNTLLPTHFDLLDSNDAAVLPPDALVNNGIASLAHSLLNVVRFGKPPGYVRHGQSPTAAAGQGLFLGSSCPFRCCHSVRHLMPDMFVIVRGADFGTLSSRDFHSLPAAQCPHLKFGFL